MLGRLGFALVLFLFLLQGLLVTPRRLPGREGRWGPEIERRDMKNPQLAQFKGAERGPGGLSQWIGSLLPNSYYSRPKHRYPYYDKKGKGFLLYGYGEEDDLHEYSVFKPLEGYYRR